MSTRPILRRLTTPLNRTMATLPHENQTFKLPDGRVLGFAEYGPADGTPVLYFHGYPSSRLEAGPVLEAARRRNLRLMALDRPGFGLSTPQPHRRILDWPADVRAFARGMRLRRFAVLGLSGGGPFALACARALPRDMLVGVGLFASGPPWVAGRTRMTLLRRAMSVAANRWPSGLRAVLAAMVGAARWLATTGWVQRRIDGFLQGLRDKKKAAEGAEQDDAAPERTIAEVREELVRILLEEPFRQGAEAAVHEARLLSSEDWGFEFEDVDYDAVRMWHGVEDGNAPVAMIRYMAERLPHSVLHEFEGDTHYTMFKHLEGALAELVGQEGGKGEVKEEA